MRIAQDAKRDSQLAAGGHYALCIVNRTADDLCIASVALQRSVETPKDDGAPSVLVPARQKVTVDGLSAERALDEVCIATATPGGITTPAQYKRRGNTGRLSAVGAEGAYHVYYLNMPNANASLIILPARNLAAWMAGVPDNTPLGDLCMPGTHETCALYGYPISQCQQPCTPPDVQLKMGVRFMDVRMKVVGDELRAYHGIRPQRSTFLAFLDQLTGFLRQNSSETVIVLMKEEANGSDQDPRFSRILHDNLLPLIHQGLLFLANRIPTLGEVRGKAILLSRFDMKEGDGWVGEDGIGIHPSIWPDSAKNGFEWDCSGTTVRIQDWYRLFSILDIPEKLSAVVNHISPNTPRPAKSFTLSYSSAAGFPFAMPTHIAKGFGWPSIGMGVVGVNERLAHWFLERLADGTRIKACVAMDFFSEVENVHELLVQMNFTADGLKEG